MPFVVARLVGQLADLHVWAKVDGAWWALISWSVYGVLDDGHNGHVTCAAWVPASTVEPSQYNDQRAAYPAVPRLVMTGDHWPELAPRPNQPIHHYGSIEQQPGPPPGVRRGTVSG